MAAINKKYELLLRRTETLWRNDNIIRNNNLEKLIKSKAFQLAPSMAFTRKQRLEGRTAIKKKFEILNRYPRSPRKKKPSPLGAKKFRSVLDFHLKDAKEQQQQQQQGWMSKLAFFCADSHTHSHTQALTMSLVLKTYPRRILWLGNNFLALVDFFS